MQSSHAEHDPREGQVKVAVSWKMFSTLFSLWRNMTDNPMNDGFHIVDANAFQAQTFFIKLAYFLQVFYPAGSLRKGALWQAGHHHVEVLFNPRRTVHHGDYVKAFWTWMSMLSACFGFTFRDMLAPVNGLQILSIKRLPIKWTTLIPASLPANIMADNTEDGVAAIMVACHTALITPVTEERLPELIAKMMAWLGAWIAWLLFLPQELREWCPMLDAFLMKSLRALSSQQGARSLKVPMNSFEVKMGNFELWIEHLQQEMEDFCLVLVNKMLLVTVPEGLQHERLLESAFEVGLALLEHLKAVNPSERILNMMNAFVRTFAKKMVQAQCAWSIHSSHRTAWKVLQTLRGSATQKQINWVCLPFATQARSHLDSALISTSEHFCQIVQDRLIA